MAIYADTLPNKRDGADRKSRAFSVKFPGSPSMLACSSSRDVIRLTKIKGYYQMITLRKMSEIMKEIALLSFKNPQVPPSSEAAHASLLFAQVAWNRALGHDMQDYKALLKVFLRSNPNLWSELRSHDAEELIEIMREAREHRYSSDLRVVLVCGMREGNVHVEWCEEKDYPQASVSAEKRLESEFGPGRII
jgi:hypothetical protein